MKNKTGKENSSISAFLGQNNKKQKDKLSTRRSYNSQEKHDLFNDGLSDDSQNDQ